MGELSARPLEPMIDASEEWAPIDWWKLEIRSFIVAPAVVRDLAIVAPQEAVVAEYTRITAASCLRSLSYLFSIVAPILGGAAMLRWAWTRGDNFQIPIAFTGALTALALLVSLYGLVQEKRHPRAVTGGSLRTVTLVHIVPGLMSLLIALTLGQRLLNGVDTLWLIIIGVDVLLHGYLLFKGPVPRGGPQNEVDNIRQGLTETPGEVLDAIQDRRQAAIRLLRSRDLIDAEAAARADASPLGELGLTMAPELARYPPNASAGPSSQV